MKVIGQTQHETLIVEMSQDEWESVREGRGVMPFIDELEFLNWAKEFKSEFSRLEISQSVRAKINDVIDFLATARDSPDHYYWEMVLTDGNHLRSFVEWAYLLTTVPDVFRGYRFWLRAKAHAELIAALEVYLQQQQDYP